MDRVVDPAGRVPGQDPQRVRAMFGAIAGRYDLLNHLLSANLDRTWRRLAVRSLPPGRLERVLDLCGGTGDLSVQLAAEDRATTVFCCDFAHPMLVRAGKKFERVGLSARCLLLEADGLRLPFGDAVFDAVTVGFGVRNLADLQGGFREIARVLRPGGALVVLEFSTPTVPVLSRLYRFYLNRILPRLGDRVSAEGGGAYAHLARTIGAFPDPATLAGRIREAGFSACGWTSLTGGIVAVHTARR